MSNDKEKTDLFTDEQRHQIVSFLWQAARLAITFKELGIDEDDAEGTLVNARILHDTFLHMGAEAAQILKESAAGYIPRAPMSTETGEA